VTDRAIAELERRVAQLQGRPGFEGPLLRARFDLLVAYRDRLRMADAVALYEKLREEGVVPPTYVRNSTAAAYLHLERPEPGHDLYRSVLAETPEDFDAQLGLFYALVELERFGDAYELIDALDREQPLFRGFADTRATYDNPRKLDTVVTAALARYYGDQLGEAWDRLAPLAEAAPGNSWLQAAAATVARDRGWPRRSLSMLAPLLTLPDEDRGLELEKARSLMAVHRYREAEPIVERLVARYPHEKDVQALQRDWDAYRAFELQTRVDVSKGGEPGVDDEALVVKTRLFSPPVFHNWRVVAGYRFANAKLPEGRERYHRGELGLEYRGPEGRALGVVTYNADTQDEVGGRLELDWTLDDHWTLYALGELFVEATPMRALKAGVTADAVEAGVVYRLHESLRVAGAGRVTSFSDDNVRYELQGSSLHRVIDVPRFDVQVGPELYLSTNSGTDGPYFAPELYATASANALGEHLTWRRYRLSFVQALELSAGASFQEGFGWDAIGSVEYAHRWRWDPWLDLSYGIRVGSRVYDGDRQADYSAFLEVTGRF
jgi:biofilm PGA synthesis protein PgaA